MYLEPLSALKRFLCLGVRASRSSEEKAELSALLQTLGSEKALEAAENNKVAPMVAAALASDLGEAALDEAWKNILVGNRTRMRALAASLEEVLKELQAFSCPAAVIENGGVLLGARKPLENFAAGDFDLLVSVESWPQAQAAFDRLGFVGADRRHRPTNRLEFRRRGFDGEEVWINIGCAPFDRMWIPLPHIDRSSIWLSRRVTAPGLDWAPVLDPSDALVLVAIHTSLHSYVRSPFIRLHADVDWLVRRCPIDWEQVVAEALQVGLPTRVWLSLEMAKFLLGTPVPEEVTDALTPTPRREARLIELIAREGSFWTGNRKLRGWHAVQLDFLLSEDGAGRWFRRAIFPDAVWLRAHFEHCEQDKSSVTKLINRRLQAALRSWRPE